MSCVYAFRQCGHQCICEQFYRNKGDTDKLKVETFVFYYINGVNI